jgi:hypothetical protein
MNFLTYLIRHTSHLDVRQKLSHFAINFIVKLSLKQCLHCDKNRSKLGFLKQKKLFVETH